MSRDRWISLSEWGVIVSVGLIDIIFDYTTSIPMDIAGSSIKLLTVLFLLWPLTALLTRYTGFAVGSEVMAENIAKFFIFVYVAGACEYYLALNPAPLQDAMLVKIDAMMGFNWPTLFDWVHSHKFIERLLSYAYLSLGIQAGIALLAMNIVYPRRANRFVTASLASSLLTLLIFAFIPVEGPFAFFNHTDFQYARYTEHYRLMRAHALMSIPMNNLYGIVSFPSFHISSAVILTYFFRRLPFVFWLAAAVNGVMLVASLVIGGHHLTDVIAGIGVGLVTIAFVHKIDGTEPEKRLPIRKPTA